MKTIHQCVVLDASQKSYHPFLSPEHLRRFFPEVADPDFERAVVEDVWATQVSSDCEDAVAIVLPAALQKFSRVFDWEAVPCMAVSLPLMASGPQGERAEPGDVNLADLVETPLFKSVQPGAHGLRTIDIDSTLSARLNTLQEIDSVKYTELVREHYLNDTVVDMSAPLELQLKSRSGAAVGTITLMLAFRMALVSRPVR
jgi:hypothetical protein